MYTHIFMIWLGLLLAVVVVLEVLRRERLFAMTALLAAIGFAATLALVNVDAAIVRQNVARVSQGEDLDVPYLASLSTDSVPALVREFQDKSLPAAARDGVGAVLACRQQIKSEWRGDWRAFTFSRLQAGRAIELVQSQLTEYEVLDTEYPVNILSPADASYDCYGSSGD
jgi:hypothetical protein